MASRFAGAAKTAQAALSKSTKDGGPFRVLVSGASGMLGQALQHSLSVPKPVNHFKPEIHTLVRHAPRSGNEIYWDPYEGDIEVEKLEGFDAVVHLAGKVAWRGGLAAIRHMILQARISVLAKGC